MDWSLFLQVLQDCEAKKQQIATELIGRHSGEKDFFKKCSLVISQGNGQFDFTSKPTVFDLLKWKSLLEDSEKKENLLLLFKSLRDLEDTKKSRPKESAALDRQIAECQDEMRAIPLEALKFIDTFHIELRFPFINQEVIRAIKEHAHVHKEKTCLCDACIRVFLY